MASEIIVGKDADSVTVDAYWPHPMPYEVLRTGRLLLAKPIQDNYTSRQHDDQLQQLAHSNVDNDQAVPQSATSTSFNNTVAAASASSHTLDAKPSFAKKSRMNITKRLAGLKRLARLKR